MAETARKTRKICFLDVFLRRDVLFAFVVPPESEGLERKSPTSSCYRTDAAPVGKRRSVFEELCISLALNCKWTMIRLICRDVLRSSWSPCLLPMTGHVVDKERSRELGVEWMVSHGEKVRASGTETLKWMLDVVESAFVT